MKKIFGNSRPELYNRAGCFTLLRERYPIRDSMAASLPSSSFVLPWPIICEQKKKNKGGIRSRPVLILVYKMDTSILFLFFFSKLASILSIFEWQLALPGPPGVKNLRYNNCTTHTFLFWNLWVILFCFPFSFSNDGSA